MKIGVMMKRRVGDGRGMRGVRTCQRWNDRTVAAKEHVELGRAALRVGDATGARAEFELGELTPEVLEGLAAASYVLSEYPRAIAEFERAYAGYRVQGDGAGSARVARTLGYMYGTTAGDWAVASGWIARAKTLLSELPQSSERGWVALTEGMFAEARAKKETAFHTAIEIGRETEDPHLTFATMSYLGASLVHGDRTEEGMALLDEALAAVAGGEVEDFIIIEEIFCQLFSACEHAQDVQRAEQWIRVGEQIAERRRLPAVSAYCRTHYGGILTAAGRWPEADVALTEAVRLWALGKRSLKAGALIRLADLRIKQGRYDEAASLLEDQTDGEAVLPRAALHLARGESTIALDLLERAAQKADPGSSACIPLLAQLVEAQLACGEDPRADDRRPRGLRRGAPDAVHDRPGRTGPGPRRAGRSAGVAPRCAGRLHADPAALRDVVVPPRPRQGLQPGDSRGRGG